MAIRVVRLGSPRAPGEGVRVGTVRRYRAGVNRPEAKRLLALLAALSRQTDFSAGRYRADETRCYRSVLKEILREHGADLA